MRRNSSPQPTFTPTPSVTPTPTPTPAITPTPTPAQPRPISSDSLPPCTNRDNDNSLPSCFHDSDSFPPYSITADNTLITNIEGYSGYARIYKLINHEWIEQTERLPSSSYYYLDGKFVAPNTVPHNDVPLCSRIPQPYSVKLIEHKQLGEKEVPPNSGTAGYSPIFQTTPLIGDLRVEISYSSDRNCHQDLKFISTVIKR